MKKTRNPSPLQKPAPVARPSSLAYGLNQGTVVSVQNHWREFYNPLRALDLPRAIALYDLARRGLNAELQNVYREMEGLYPTLMALIERRTSPLLELEIEIKTTPIDQRPAQRGVSQTLADDQAAVLRDAYESIDNLYEAIEWLEMGAFRGYAHLEKIYANPGTSDWTVRHLEPVEQWHWTRSSMYAEWEYAAAATQTNMGVPINYEQFLIHEARRPLDRVALILWIRANLCEKDWDAFIEIYGVPHWIVFMPPNVPKEKESEYLTAARSIMQGGTGALPHGSEAKAADSPATQILFVRASTGCRSSLCWPARADCSRCSPFRPAWATAPARRTTTPSKKSAKKKRAKSAKCSTRNSTLRCSPANSPASRPWPTSPWPPTRKPTWAISWTKP